MYNKLIFYSHGYDRYKSFFFFLKVSFPYLIFQCHLVNFLTVINLIDSASFFYSWHCSTAVLVRKMLP